jgi:hypothetical protein
MSIYLSLLYGWAMNLMMEWLEIARNGWKWQEMEKKWLEMTGMSESGMKWQKWLEWLKMAEHFVKG